MGLLFKIFKCYFFIKMFHPCCQHIISNRMKNQSLISSSKMFSYEVRSCTIPCDTWLLDKTCAGYCKQCCSKHWGGVYLLALWFSLGVYPGVGLLGHTAAPVLVFKGTSILFAIVPVSIYIPINRVGGFPFLHILSSINHLQIFGWWSFSSVGGDT